MILAFSQFVALILVSSPVQAQPTPGAPVYLSVEPQPVSPLTDLNASVNGLQTPPTPLPPATSPVGQNFTVEIHLRNATITNVVNGVLSIEVHFYFGNILNYCTPIGFKDMLGLPGGILNGPVIEAITGGFYNSTGWKCKCNPPYDDFVGPYFDGVGNYTGPVEYDVAGAETGGTWNGTDGLVATVTFQITGQPSNAFGQPDFYASLQITYSDMYTVDSTHQHPVQQPFSIIQGTLQIGRCTGVHNVAAADPPAKTVVGQGYGVNVTVTVSNVGNYSEIFCRVTVYANATYIGASKSLILSAGSSVNVTFPANGIAGLAYGNYTLRAYAPSFGEPNRNNNSTCGNVTLTIPGDITGDFKDNLSDLGKLAKAYNSRPTSANWNANADINNDGLVSLSDLGILAKHYNQHYP